MLGSSLPSTLLTFESGTLSRFSPDLESYLANPVSCNAILSYTFLPIEKKRLFPTKSLASTRWRTHSSRGDPETVLSEEDVKKWEACRQALSGFEFTLEEEDKILGKAFGLLRSPYWGEERELVVPQFEEIDAILDYLRGLGLSDEDISKLKHFGIRRSPLIRAAKRMSWASGSKNLKEHQELNDELNLKANELQKLCRNLCRNSRRIKVGEDDDDVAFYKLADPIQVGSSCGMPRWNLNERYLLFD